MSTSTTRSTTNSRFEVLIVGAGPVGLYAAYCAGFRGLSVAVVDSLTEVGGQISAMYPEKHLYDIAGFPQIRGRELVHQLHTQMSIFNQPIFLGQQARQLSGSFGDFTVTTDAGTEIHASTVLLTSGIGTFTPRPPAAGTEFLERGLSYFVKQPEELQDKDVVILGGGDSAVDWALMLEPFAASVNLVHRRNQFRAHEHSVKLLRASTVGLFTNARVTAIVGNDAVEAVHINHDGQEVTLKADHVVSALGFLADLGPLTDWGLEMRERYVAVDKRMSTTRDGVFAAGDLTDFDGKVRLLSVGFGEAASAVSNIAVRLDPARSLMPGHSSDQVPPQTVSI